VNLQDGLSAPHIRTIQDDAAVETSGSQQGWVEDVRAVGGGDDDHIGISVEAIHLHQDLVEGLLALVVTAAQTGAPVAAHGVNLIDEDDAGAVTLRLVKQVTHAAGADAHEHLDKFRTGDAEERNARLTADGLGQQRLACTRAAYQQDAFRDPRAELNKALRVLEEFNDFFQLLFGLFSTRYVIERHRWLVSGEHARAALAKRYGLIV